MARRQAVTRNVKGTEAHYLAFNLETMEAVELFKTIPAAVGRTESAVAKYLERVYKDSVNFKFLKVIDLKSIDVLYGMYLEDFIKYAVPLTADRKFPDGSSADDSDTDSDTDGTD